MNLASELVTVQAQLSRMAAESADRGFLGISESVRRLVSELRSTAMEMRLVRVEGLFSRYGRLVRDVSKELGKEAELVAEGGDTELDKNAVEGLVDPLMHLLRNAVGHGLETPEEGMGVVQNATSMRIPSPVIRRRSPSTGSPIRSSVSEIVPATKLASGRPSISSCRMPTRLPKAWFAATTISLWQRTMPVLAAAIMLRIWAASAAARRARLSRTTVTRLSMTIMDITMATKSPSRTSDKSPFATMRLGSVLSKAAAIAVK